jgi:hypothetical protein
VERKRRDVKCRVESVRGGGGEGDGSAEWKEGGDRKDKVEIGEGVVQRAEWKEGRGWWKGQSKKSVGRGVMEREEWEGAGAMFAVTQEQT